MNRICNAYLDNDAKCQSKYQLHTILFFYTSENQVELVQVCKPCYERIMKVLNEPIVTLTRKRDNLIAKRAQDARIAKEYGNVFYKDTERQKIEDLTTVIKNMALNQCRNYLCMKNLQTLGLDAKIFSVSTYKPSGKRHQTFYLCSLKCFKRMKAIFGETEKQSSGQQLLDNILVK